LDAKLGHGAAMIAATIHTADNMRRPKRKDLRQQRPNNNNNPITPVPKFNRAQTSAGTPANG